MFRHGNVKASYSKDHNFRFYCKRSILFNLNLYLTYYQGWKARYTSPTDLHRTCDQTKRILIIPAAQSVGASSHHQTHPVNIAAVGSKWYQKRKLCAGAAIRSGSPQDPRHDVSFLSLRLSSCKPCPLMIKLFTHAQLIAEQDWSVPPDLITLIRHLSRERRGRFESNLMPASPLLMSSPGAMRRYIRPLLMGCVFLIIVAAYYNYPLPSDTAYLHSDTRSLDFLRRAKSELTLDLSAEVIYSRRCIKISTSNEPHREEVTRIAEPLVVNPVVVPLADQGSSEVSLPPCASLKLKTAEPHVAGEKFPELIFGMATTYERLNAPETIESIEHWASGRDSKLYVMVEDHTKRPAETRELQALYRDRGVQAHFIAPLSDSTSTSQNHFLVLTEMVRGSGPETKWFGLLDDDTFFPHLKPLATALGQLDHTVDMYVGALSEDFGSVRNFGIMAYGGAGVYLSVHLAKKLGTLEQATACLDEAAENLGDILVRNCVYHHSRTKLTPLPGL